MILYVNSCIRAESRTDRIARALLKTLYGEVTEVFLPREDLRPLDEATLAKRSALAARGDFSDPMFRFAKQFAAADTVVIGAPFYDMSFPALLKIYLENVCVMGLVSRYGEDGMPHGLCRAGKLYYVTTAGGYFDPAFGYEQFRALARSYFGIPETTLIAADRLDIDGSDAEAIVAETIRTIPERVSPAFSAR